MDLSGATVSEIIGIHYVPLNEGDCFNMQNRPYSSVAICPNGCVSYIMDDEVYTADPTHMVFLPKGISYEVHCKKTCKCKLVSFNLTEMYDAPIVYAVSDNEPLFEKFDEMKNMFLLETKNSHAACMSYLYAIFANACSQKDVTPSTLTNAVRFIDNEYCCSEITCADIASVAGISEIYLRKLFSKYFGVSPKEYILRKRFDKAKELLRTRRPYISGIADECGFSSVNHFCKIFKARYGLTPTEFSDSFFCDNGGI